MYPPSLLLSIAIVITSSLGPGPVDSGVIIDYHPPPPPADQAVPDSPSPPAQHPPGSMHHEQAPPERRGEEEEATTPGQKPEEPCLECEQERQLARLRATHSEEEIHTLRIEHIKQQILRKLRLEAPPNITSRPTKTIPEPLREIFDREEASVHDPASDTDIEEFYGRKTEVIVFGSRIENCEDDNERLAACFHFELENKLSVEEMDSAELFVYKTREHGRRPVAPKTLSVYDLTHAHTPHRLLAETRVLDRRGRWVSLDVKHTVRRWLQRPERNHGVQIACAGCQQDEHAFPVHASGEKKPFLVIHTRDVRRKRPKRSGNDCPSDSSCCMERFYVSFKELGWDSWIIRPEGYHANFCKGNCRMLPSLNRNRPNQMLVHILQKASEVQNAPDLLPCCAPTRMSQRSILYYNQSERVVMENLPNMIVESCGCS